MKDEGDPLWQQDFPINRGEELNNSRRQFLKFLGLTSLAFFTGTLGVGRRRCSRSGGRRNYRSYGSRRWPRCRKAVRSKQYV